DGITTLRSVRLRDDAGRACRRRSPTEPAPTSLPHISATYTAAAQRPGDGPKLLAPRVIRATSGRRVIVWTLSPAADNAALCYPAAAAESPPRIIFCVRPFGRQTATIRSGRPGARPPNRRSGRIPGASA